MLYQSTRGLSPKISFAEAIVKGIADDGGLYVPERIPAVSRDFIASLAYMDYAGAAAEIIKLYTGGAGGVGDFTSGVGDFVGRGIPDAPVSLDGVGRGIPDAPHDPGGFSDREILECTRYAYGKRADGIRAFVSHDDVAPLHILDENISVLELYHGPTAAFKDVALQLLPRLLTLSLQKTGVKETVAIIVATSGDTGKAALEGFHDVPGASILVFYPKDGVSQAQKIQMVTQEGKNVAVAAVDGNFDDAQTGVKAIFADEDINRRLHKHGIRLSSANSINWGRLLPQIVYYFRAYATLLRRGAIAGGEQIRFVVPTGNFGNILAGWYARQMGLPVSRLICASNSNKILTDFINTGVYDLNRELTLTMSPSMDILVSSNLERLLFEASGRDAAYVRRLMGELAHEKRYDAGGAVHKYISNFLHGGYATEKETADAIRDTYKRYNYLIDTHTAVGMHVYRAYAKRGGDEKAVILSTASPYKFARDVYTSIAAEYGGDSGGVANACNADDELGYIDLLSAISGTAAPEALRGLRGKPVLHRTETPVINMKETALRLLTGPGAG